VTRADAVQMGKEMAAVLREALRLRDERIVALENKITLLEAIIELKNFVYVGVFKEGRTYAPGQFATHAGGLWHCNRFHTTTKPGVGDGAWTLAVKSGRGRDGDE
jgi:hypothetical protein